MDTTLGSGTALCRRTIAKRCLLSTIIYHTQHFELWLLSGVGVFPKSRSFRSWMAGREKGGGIFSLEAKTWKSSTPNISICYIFRPRNNAVGFSHSMTTKTTALCLKSLSITLSFFDRTELANQQTLPALNLAFAILCVISDTILLKFLKSTLKGANIP